jgi:hypothetical protein
MSFAARDRIVRSGVWLGALAGGGAGLLFLVITVVEVTQHGRSAGFVGFLIPLLAIVAGAALGRWSFRAVAEVLVGISGPVARVVSGFGLGALAGVLVLVVVAELTYLLMQWSGQLDFVGGAPALVPNVLAMFALFGAIAGGAVGLGFGTFAAFVLRSNGPVLRPRDP